MISKSQIKLINSLRIKKYRKEHGLFIAEGDKLVRDIISSSFKVDSVFATGEWIKSNQTEIQNLENKVFTIAEAELKKISSLKTPNQVLAIVQMPKYGYEKSDVINNISLALDDIQDPGNLGSIIRIADWFGISDIFCSSNCVDAYNSKVIQSSMGSVCRVRLHCVALAGLLEDYDKEEDFKIFGTFLEGENIFESDLSKNGIIVLGNESSGISEELLPYIHKKLFIPNYSRTDERIDSLNVSMASAIICFEFRRRTMKLT
jgi:TrmH family RNA methyltransferase